SLSGASCSVLEGPGDGWGFSPARNSAPGLDALRGDGRRRAGRSARARGRVGRVGDERPRKSRPTDGLPGGPAGTCAAAAAPAAAAGLPRPRATPPPDCRPGPPPLRGPRAGFARTRTAGGVRRGGPVPGTGLAPFGGGAAPHRPAAREIANAPPLPFPRATAAVARGRRPG